MDAPHGSPLVIRACSLSSVAGSDSARPFGPRRMIRLAQLAAIDAPRDRAACGPPSAVAPSLMSSSSTDHADRAGAPMKNRVNPYTRYAPRKSYWMATMLISMLTGCGSDERSAARVQPAAQVTERPETAAESAESFRVEAERFADVRVLRYRAPGFEELAPKTKELLYYLYEAALSGREIIYDQKYRYNLAIRRTLEEVVKHYPGDRGAADFQALDGVSEARLVLERHSSPLLERQVRARLRLRRVRADRQGARRASSPCARGRRWTSCSRSSSP